MHHWHARVAGDRQQVRASLLDAAGSRDAQIAPNGVFHVLIVVLLIFLELLGAFLVLAGVVIRDAALPQTLRGLRVELHVLVEVGDRLGNVSGAKLLAATAVPRQRELRVLLDYCA